MGMEYLPHRAVTRTKWDEHTEYTQEGLARAVFSEWMVVHAEGMLSPACIFLPQVMLESSVYLTLAVYSSCCLLAAVASCFLPIETKGRGLQESSHREWGQEMVGRGTHGTGVPRSNSGSQE